MFRHSLRLLAEKVNKVERKGSSEIFVFNQRTETGDFWKTLDAPSSPWMEEPKVRCSAGLFCGWCNSGVVFF